MKFSNVYLLSFFLFISLNGMAQLNPVSAADVEKIKKGLQEMNANTSSISANFTQEKNMSFLSERVRSSGKFYYMKEAKVRWEYESPTKYTAIISEGKIHIDDGERKNTVDTRSSKSFKELNEMMLQCIDGTISTNPDYKVSYFAFANNYVIRLEPKSKNLKEFIVNIDLYTDKQNFAVNAIRLLESADGDFTHIKFQERKFNQTLDPKLFRSR